MVVIYILLIVISICLLGIDKKWKRPLIIFWLGTFLALTIGLGASYFIIIPLMLYFMIKDDDNDDDE